MPQLAWSLAHGMLFQSRCLTLTLLEPLLPSEPIRASKTVGPLVGAREGCQLPHAVKDALTSEPACIEKLAYCQQVHLASRRDMSISNSH